MWADPPTAVRFRVKGYIADLREDIS